MPDVLIELLSEEIPARMQARAAADLKALVTDGLVEAGLTYAGAGAFHTPRRLVLAIEGLSERSRATREERKGPAVGAPDKAVDGFARSAGVAREALEMRDTGKGQAWFAVLETPGREADAILAEVLDRVIRSFPWPKSMRWGAGSLRWVRPLHSILAVLHDQAGSRVVPLAVDDIVAGDVTRGHRFMAPKPFSVNSFEDYEAKLARAKVVLRAEARAETIRAEIEAAAFARGFTLVEDEGLMAEVSGLVEWPVVLVGRIEERFLDLPPEVLRTSMKEHQKFFSLKAASGRIEAFATVANIETVDGGATILAGNAKVLAARLSDAMFFWQNDLAVAKAGMGEWAEGLKSVTFHRQLGSQADRVARIEALARSIAPMVGADADEAAEAARLSKLDLRSEMVGEFPELQGLMGRYYSAAAGRSEAVAAAVQEHYAPLGPSDAVPGAPVSIAVALADKIDTLTGFWAIDEKPTGSKDPFALRRAALGVIRLVLENDLLLSLSEGLASHFDKFETGAGPLSDLLAFLHDRLKVHLRAEGLRPDVIDAVLAMPGSDDLALVVRRARALQQVLDTEDGENLIQGYRRASNLLAQAEAKDGVEYSYGADRKFAETPEETALFDALDRAAPEIDTALTDEDFARAMAAMASLRQPIDRFFESVQVNAESQLLRRNRLNLLHRIRSICGGVADLTRITDQSPRG